MKLRYTAKKGRETVSGIIEAESRESGIIELEAQGYLPIKVEEFFSKVDRMTAWRSPKISSSDINGFIRELSMLVKARLPLITALEALRRETIHKNLKELIADLEAGVRHGDPLSTALAKHPQFFSRVLINMIVAGETGGALDSVLLRLVEYADREEDMRARIRSALAYPVLMAVMGCVTIMIMITFVMPKLSAIFIDMNQELPAPTRMLMYLSAVFQAGWYWFILVGAAAFLLIKKYRLVERNQVAMERFLFSFPVTGRYLKMKGVSQFFYTLSLMLANGIPIRDAISATIPTLGSRVIETELRAINDGLSEGSTVAKCISRSAFFPPHVVSLIRVGEESGRLDNVLHEIAIAYDKKLDMSLKTFSALFEPMIILTVGLIVGGIVIAMILPIFEFNVR